MLSLLLDAVILGAVALAVQGVWLVLRSLGSEARVVARRMARPTSPSGGEPAAPATATSTPAAASPMRGPLARLADRVMPSLQRRLLAARAPFTPVQVLLGSLGLFVIILIAGRWLGLPPLLALVLGAWSGLASPTLLIAFLARRRQRLFTNQMPQAVELIARALQAGHPVTASLAVVAQQMSDPIGPEFASVISEINFGQDRDVALRHLARRFPIPELRMFSASLEVTRETGGNLAEVFLNLAQAMRAKAQLRKKVAAISAEGKASFYVVSLLPVGVVSALVLLNHDYYGSVMSDPLFWPLMCGPPVLWAIGALAIWRLINFRI